MANADSISPGIPHEVAWDDFVRFVRQLSHDLRNHLNALELQSVFLNELAADEEMKVEIRRLRETVTEVTAELQKLSAALTNPKANRIPYDAAELMEDIQKKFESNFADRKSRILWQIEAGPRKIEIDPQLFQQAIFELLDNAFRFSPKDASFTMQSRAGEEGIVFSLREPKKEFASSMADWGRPLVKTAHGHYSLGLNRVRAIVAAHDGQFGAEYDPVSQTLVTTIMLPALRGGT